MLRKKSDNLLITQSDNSRPKVVENFGRKLIPFAVDIKGTARTSKRMETKVNKEETKDEEEKEFK